jgi:putative ABC transport system substrate-binding protein
MNRRSFLGLLGGIAGTRPFDARPESPRVYRIGYLHPTDAQDPAPIAFKRALKELGYIVGENTILEERFAENHLERLPALAAELVANRVDIVVAVSPTAIRAARAVTQTIPIVMAFNGRDPVEAGFAATLARPGGNTTGVTSMSKDVAPKWIELLAELVPGLKRVAVLQSEDDPSPAAMIDALAAAAERKGIELQIVKVKVRDIDRYAEAFSTIASGGGQAVVLLPAPEFTRDRARLVELANRYRLPSVSMFAEFALVGGLVSYGPDMADLSSRAVTYVDKILKGANPGELPIERPRKFALVINRRTAKALGLRIPPALLLDADEVIG